LYHRCANTWCRVDDAEWARYKGLAVPEGAEGAKRESRGPAAQEAVKQSWSDKIIISQDMQVTAEAPGCALAPRVCSNGNRLS
jgi:hypothetical protein